LQENQLIPPLYDLNRRMQSTLTTLLSEGMQQCILILDIVKEKQRKETSA